MSGARDLGPFVAAVLENEGASTEPLGDGTTLALLPSGLAALLNRGEEFRFRADPEGPPDAELVAYGSDTLARLAELACARGRAAHAVLPVSYLKKGDLEPMAREALAVDRATRRYGSGDQCVASYLVLRLHYRATSVDTREGALSFVFNESTGAAVDGMLDLVESGERLEPVGTEAKRAVARKPFAFLLDRAQLLSRREIEPRLVDFRAAMERRLARDWERMTEYYAQLLQETDRKLFRAFGDEASEKLTAKRAAILADLEAKRRDLVARYAIRVDVEVTSALRLFALTLRIACRLELRGATRTVHTFWNPFTKAVEPLFCEACNHTTRAFIACDKLHLACGSCAGNCPACGRRICRVCSPRGCSACAKA